MRCPQESSIAGRLEEFHLKFTHARAQQGLLLRGLDRAFRLSCLRSSMQMTFH